MKISTLIGYAGGYKESARWVVEMEQAGLDLVWVPEAYGFDAPSMMGYLAALTTQVEIGSGILPIYSRTPSLLAMTAAGLDALSDGRFHLGLGASGPQVVEGWHGVRYDAPLGRTREIVDICRKVWAREEALEYEGRYYNLPLPAGEGSGLGKPLKIITHPVRPRIPIWTASLGDRNVAVAAEIADGWLPLFFVPEKAAQVWGGALAAGKSLRSPDLGPLMISAGGLLAIGEGADVIELRELGRPNLALYIGGMGAKGRNFYNDLACRYGYEKEAELVQDLFLAGKRQEAAAALPAELVELTSLCGPAGWVKERVAAMEAAGVTHLQVNPVAHGGKSESEVLRDLKELIG